MGKYHQFAKIPNWAWVELRNISEYSNKNLLEALRNGERLQLPHLRSATINPAAGQAIKASRHMLPVPGRGAGRDIERSTAYGLWRELSHINETLYISTQGLRTQSLKAKWLFYLRKSV
jgi:hypothetical protein